MKQYLLLLLFMLISLVSYSQNADWYSFYEDEERDRIGFEDEKGNIMVSPKFDGLFMRGGKFSNITAVMEDGDGSFTGYYLSKDGLRFGHDSMYVFDMAFDCEREGFIRFQPSSDKTGLFNKEGEIVISADYNALSEVNNGLLIGLKGAHKERNGEYWSWDGGIEYLIDTANNILVENFEFDPLIDFHSMKIEDSASTDSLRKNFLGTNGKYYTFVDNEKAFRYWFFNDLLANLSKKNLMQNSFEIISWQDNSHFGIEESNELIAANYDLMKERLFEVLKKDCKYSISLNDYVDSDLHKQCEEYLDNCGNLKYSQYSQFSVIINYYKNGSFDFQDHFDFLKTAIGYKLLSLCLRDVDLK